jgi:hypothetical protein
LKFNLERLTARNASLDPAGRPAKLLFRRRALARLRDGRFHRLLVLIAEG